MIIDCSDYVGSVPVSKLPHLVQETKKDIAENGLKAGIVGHVGDGMTNFYLFLFFSCGSFTKLLIGNFHALILFHNDEELEKVSQCVHRLVHRALALDGTCESFRLVPSSGSPPCPMRL